MQQLDPIYVDLTQSSAELLQLRRELAAGRLQDNQTLPVSILMEDGSTFEHKGTLGSPKSASIRPPAASACA